MYKRAGGLFFFFIVSVITLVSCQKEIGGTILNTGGGGGVIPVNQKPKVGTTWTYRYNWNNGLGAPTHVKIVSHKAKSEEMLGGEKWLKIVDVETDTTVYFLNTKTDELYQYTNSNSYLLCKYPAVVNDTYTTFNGGSAEFFTVRGVNDTIPTGIGDIPLSKYEGEKVGYLIDVLWYNTNAWIVRQYQYRLIPVSPSPIYYLYSRMFIQSIVY